MADMADTAFGETSEARAARAAEDLAAGGSPVSARAVRERAGVAMTVAAEAARTWNARMAEQQSVPDLPDDVRARLEGIWRTAYVAARQEFDEVRTGWAGKVATAEKDAAELAKTVADLEQQLEREQTDAHKTSQELAEVRAEIAEVRTRAAKVEGALEAVTDERDRLLAERDEVRRAASR